MKVTFFSSGAAVASMETVDHQVTELLVKLADDPKRPQFLILHDGEEKTIINWDNVFAVKIENRS